MARARPNIYRGFEAACIRSGRTGVFYAHVTNVRGVMIPFRFRQIGQFNAALRAAVDAYLSDCRFAGRKPQKPMPPTARERAIERRISARLRRKPR